MQNLEQTNSILNDNFNNLNVSNSQYQMDKQFYDNQNYYCQQNNYTNANYYEGNNFNFEQASYYQEYKKVEKSVSNLPLILALFGLIGSFIFGIGAVLSIVGLVLGIAYNIKTPHSNHRMAIGVSITSIVLSVFLVFFVLIAFI